MEIKNNSRESRTSHSYDEAVDLTGHGLYNRLLLGTCSLISNAVALDSFGFSVVVVVSRCDLGLGITQTGLLASAPFLGLIIASFPFGYYADTRGRKRALLLSTSVGFLLAALGSLSPTWQVMLVLKLIGCAFSTAAYTLTSTILGECTNSKYRSRYLLIMNSGNLAAEIVIFSFAYIPLTLTFVIPIPWLGITFRPWRLYTFMLALPLGIGAVMMFFHQESPKFLANKGDDQKALEVLKKIYVANGGKADEYPVKQLSLDNVEETGRQSFLSSIVKQTVPLFRPPLLWRTLQLFYLIGVCCSTNNAFLMWYPKIVNIFFGSIKDVSENSDFCKIVVSNTAESVGDNEVCDDSISPETIYSGLIIGVLFASLSLLASIIASKRKLVLISILTVSVASLLLVNQFTDPIANMIAFTMIQVTAVGIGCVLSYFVDLYPTSHRGLVSSLGVMVARLISFSGVNLLGVTIVEYCSMTFYFWAVYVIVGIVIAFFLPGDSKET